MKSPYIGIITALLSFPTLYSHRCEARPLDKVNASTFYVAPDGNNRDSGRKLHHDGAEGPFATLGHARDVLRKMRADGQIHGPVTVWMRGGRYELSEPLAFTPEDGGADDSPVTYAAYKNEEPVLSGGRRITGWKRGEGDLWIADVPGVKEGQGYFRQLFVNGHRRQRARLPNTGFYQMDGMISTDPQAKFKFRGEEIKPEWAGGDAEIFSVAKWADFRMPLIAVDAATKTATTGNRINEQIRENDQRYVVENVREGLDSPGEWYLDRKTGILAYWPMPGEGMAKAEVIAPSLTSLVRLEGDPAKREVVRNVRLEGLTFSHTDWTREAAGYVDSQAAYSIPATVQGIGAVSCAVERCRFIHLGNYAVEFARGCKNNRIVGDEMTDLGAGGVKIGETEIRDDENEQTSGNVVSDNHIHDIGTVFPDAIGVWIGQSSDNTVAHNHIHDTYYSAISVGWTWGYGKTNAKGNVIEYNDAHDLGRGLLSDMGGIYTLGVQPGTIIRNNLFHDVSSFDYGGWGIYPDEGSSNILIENNIVYNTKSGGLHQHYGKDNVVRNNIFALAYGKQGQIIRTRQEDHKSFTFERNIVYWKDGPLLGSNWEGDDTYFIDRNLYWKTGGQPFDFAGANLADWRKRGHDMHSLIADALFTDPEHGKFTLKSGSVASKIGFHPIDMSQVGPRGPYQERKPGSK